MIQITLIKNADTLLKKVGDIVNVYEGDKTFAPEYPDQFHIVKIEGFKTALEFKLFLNTMMETKRAHRMAAPANEWAFEEPESKDFWRELPDGKWCEKVTGKYKWNYFALTEEERKLLSEPEMTMVVRKAVLAKMENRVKAEPENLVEQPELNAVAVLER